MIKCGIDIVSNRRIESKFGDSVFLEKVFSIPELRDKAKLISVFALKEAVMKALGKKVNWKEIEVRYEKSGKPSIILDERLKPERFKGVDGSVSHDGDYTIGIVIIELEDK